MARDSSLWMGGVEKYMTEEFLKKAFDLSLTESSVISVKVIRNKFTGERAPYAYINFDSDAAALMAMHRLTNKMVPHSQPVSSDLILNTKLKMELKYVYGSSLNIQFLVKYTRSDINLFMHLPVSLHFDDLFLT